MSPGKCPHQDRVQANKCLHWDRVQAFGGKCLHPDVVQTNVPQANVRTKLGSANNCQQEQLLGREGLQPMDQCAKSFIYWYPPGKCLHWNGVQANVHTKMGSRQMSTPRRGPGKCPHQEGPSKCPPDKCSHQDLVQANIRTKMRSRQMSAPRQSKQMSSRQMSAPRCGPG